MRVYKKIEMLNTSGAINDVEAEYLKKASTRKNYLRYIINEVIDLYYSKKIHAVLDGTMSTRNIDILSFLRGRDRVIEDLNKYFIKQKNNLKSYDIDVYSSPSVREDFCEGSAIVIDFETTEINNITDVDILFFSALDTKTDEFIDNDINRLLSIIDNRLVVGHNIRFDFNCLKVLLNNCGYKLVNNHGVISTKTKNIIDKYVFETDSGKRISFYTYDTYNVFPFSLKVISDLFMDFKEVINFKYSDKISKKGITIDVDPMSVDLSKIDGVTSHVEVNGNKLRLFASSDLGVKNIVLALRHNFSDSPIYREYNRNDVYLTAVAFLFFDLYYCHVFGGLGFDVKVNRKYTIAGISYDVLLQISRQNVVEMIKAGYLGILSSRKMSPIKFRKMFGKLKRIDDNFYFLRNNVFYVSKNDKCVYHIHMPYLRRAFKKAYRGGIVYFKDTDMHKSDDNSSILQFDINSSYPNAMNYIEINPYARIFCVKPNKIDLFLTKYGKYIRKCNNDKIRRFFDFISIDNLAIVKKYPELYNLVNLCLDGSISIIIRGKLKYVNDSLYGINKCFKVLGKQFSANVYGHVDMKSAMFSIYDVIRADMDMDITMLYITINHNGLLRRFIDTAYNMRLKLKRANNSFETALKLLLNSMYGKLGSNIDNVKKFYVAAYRCGDINVLPKNVVMRSLRMFLTKPQYDSLISSLKRNEYSGRLGKFYKFSLSITSYRVLFCMYSKTKFKSYLYTMTTDKVLLTVSTRNKYMHKNNVFMASHITSFGRLLLYAYARNLCVDVSDVLYSDTDSVICRLPNKVNYEQYIGEGLGLLKLERNAKQFKAVKKKFYMIDTIKKAKGLGHNVVKDINFASCNVIDVYVSRVCGKYEPGVMKRVRIHVNEYKEVSGCINTSDISSIKTKLICSIRQ